MNDSISNSSVLALPAVLTPIRSGLRLLAENPEAGAPYEVLDGRRRFVSGAYIIDYRIKNGTLQVSRIRHGRQMPLELEKDGNLPDESVCLGTCPSSIT